MSALAGIHHVKLPVSNVERSRAWYQRVLDLVPHIDFVEDGVLMGVAMSSPDGSLELALRQDSVPAKALAGFDPFALAVSTHSDLQQWRDRLDRLGEPHGGIVVVHIGWVIAGVHDTDGIEVRLYTVERHDGQLRLGPDAAPAVGRSERSPRLAFHLRPGAWLCRRVPIFPQGVLREEHRRAAQPDEGPDQRRGAVRRAQAETSTALTGSSPSRSTSRASGRARRRPACLESGSVAAWCSTRWSTRPFRRSTSRPSERRRGPHRSVSPTSRSPRSRTADPRVHRRGRRPSGDHHAGLRRASRSTVDDVEVTDDEVDEQLDGLRARFGTLTSRRASRAAGRLRLTRPLGDRRRRGGRGLGDHRLSYEIGSGQLMEGIDDALVGASQGDERTVTAVLAAGELCRA